jgi:hypothetical protein
MLQFHQNNLTPALDTRYPFSGNQQFDLIVAGAGTAGVAAAITAARSGHRTLLVTRRSVLGGNSGDLLVHSMSGFYRTSPDVIPLPANGGFALEFARRFIEYGGGCGPVRAGQQDIFLRKPTDFSNFCVHLCKREKNLTFILDSHIEGVTASEGRIDSIEIAGHQGILSASIFIDATRDAELAFLAGADMVPDTRLGCGRTAFLFEIGEVPFEFSDNEGRLAFSSKVVEGIRSGLLNPLLAFAVMHLAPLPGTPPMLIDFDSEGDHYSTLNPENLIRVQILGENLALELQSYLRLELEGFDKCRVRIVPALSPPRVSRRVVGRYCLTVDDIATGARFSDAVCLSSWPAGVCGVGGNLAPEFSGRPGDIPLRSLIAKDFSNLLMAGRCMSTEYGVQGALRVAGTCFAVGQAAGLAASAMVLSDGKSIPCGGEDSVASGIYAEVLKEF